jgi:hypothetical protein
VNAFVVAFIFSLGAGAWIYSKVAQRTGYGNNQSALMVTGIAFVLIFFVVFITARMLLGGSEG